MPKIQSLALSLAALGAVALLTAAPAQAQKPKGKDKAAGGNPKVLLDTSMGPITIELDAKAAPRSTANFLEYVKAGHYDGTVFHRVIGTFMVQGGGMTPDMGQKPTRAPIQNEADNGLKNLRGTVAMARTSDPHSATAQFFINVVDNAFLDHREKTNSGWGYTVFGKVVDGMKTVDAIKAVKTGMKGMHRDVPVEPVLIKKAKAL